MALVTKFKLTSSQTMKSLPEFDREEETGEESYHMWMCRIKGAINFLEQRYWNGYSNWRRAYDIFKSFHWRDRGESDPTSDNTRDRITVNQTQAAILAILPFLISTDAEFKLEARKPSGVISAELQQEALNYEWSENRIQDQVYMSALDGMICGHGIIKTGFNTEIDEAVAKSAGELNYDEMIKKEKPYGKRVSPFYFLYDITGMSHNLDTARWCCEIYFKPISDVIENTRYTASVRKKIKSGEYNLVTKDSLRFGRPAKEASSISYLDNDSAEDLPESKLAVLYEVWDKKFKKYYVFADGAKEPLIEEDWPYDYLDGFPYIKFDYIALPDEPYGVGVPYQVEDQQLELNLIRTAMFEHNRRFKRFYEMLSSVEPSERTKLVEGEDGTIIIVNQTGSVKAVEHASMSPDILATEGRIQADFASLTGMDALTRGEQLPSRTTGTEVNTRTGLFKIKLDGRIAAVNKLLLTTGQQIMAHIKANVQKDRIIKLFGEKGQLWVKVTPQDIQEDVDISMESVAAPKTDPAVDRQQRIQILQIVSQYIPLIQTGQMKVDLEELLAWVLESFDYKDIGRFFPRALEPVQELKELTVQEFSDMRQQQAMQQGQQPAVGGQPPAQTQIGMAAGMGNMGAVGV